MSRQNSSQKKIYGNQQNIHIRHLSPIHETEQRNVRLLNRPCVITFVIFVFVLSFNQYNFSTAQLIKFSDGKPLRMLTSEYLLT